MHRNFVLVRALLAVIGLLLVGPQKASAQTVSACVSNIGNVYIVAGNAACQPGFTKITLGTGGALGASQFSCAGDSDNVANGAPISGTKGYTAGVTFGSGVGYTPPGSSFVLQTGIYQVQLNVPVELNQPGGAGLASLGVNVLVNGNVVDSGSSGLAEANSNGQAAFMVVGDLLLQITGANSVVSFNVSFNPNVNPAVFLDGCRIVFTRLQ